MNYLIPVIFFCAFTPGENHACNGQTALWKHDIAPVQHNIDGTTTVINNPIACLMAGYQEVAKEMAEFSHDHPNKELEFRVLCKRTETNL